MGLAAALLWGATDFLIGINARSVGVKKAVFFSQLTGLIVLSVALAMLPSQVHNLAGATGFGWSVGLVAALFTVSGALAISKAFMTGKTSIVAPLVTTYGVFTVFFSWAGGEQISTLQFFGIMLCVIGVVLASSQLEKTADTTTLQTHRSIGYALLAAFLYGTSFWIQGKHAIPALGPIAVLWIGYLVGTVTLFIATLDFNKPINAPRPKVLFLLCVASLLNLGGFASFAFGAMNGSLSVVTIISTLSGGIAAILGFLILKERLSRKQIFGTGLVLASAIVLHLSKQLH